MSFQFQYYDYYHHCTLHNVKVVTQSSPMPTLSQRQSNVVQADTVTAAKSSKGEIQKRKKKKGWGDTGQQPYSLSKKPKISAASH
jgi:hypothetical protein